MLKFILTLSLLLLTNLTYAQQKNIKTFGSTSGMVIYSSRISLYKIITSKDTLKFNREGSIFYHQNHKKKKKTTKTNYKGRFTNFSIAAHDSIGEYNFFKNKNDSLYSRKFILNKIYFVKAKKPAINWHITQKTKKIGNYTCTKALAHFRGRDYTVWFTPKIPVPYGPWKLIGLPGLILQAHENTNKIYYKAAKFKLTKVNTLGSPPLNGNEETITLPQYKEALKNMKKTMAKMGEKVTRQYAKKHHLNISSSNMTIKVVEPNPMEIFTDSTDN